MVQDLKSLRLHDVSPLAVSSVEGHQDSLTAERQTMEDFASTPPWRGSQALPEKLQQRTAPSAPIRSRVLGVTTHVRLCRPVAGRQYA